MYESPIELMVTNIYNQIQKQQDEEIYKVVLQYVPYVDKEELIRALRYDRGQYEAGYADGKRDAMDELVRCKDCISGHEQMYGGLFRCNVMGCGGLKPDDFCSYGERRDTDGD